MARIARIVSDGHPSGTHVWDDRGQEIENITFISWDITPGQLGRATIGLYDVKIEAEGEVEIQNDFNGIAVTRFDLAKAINKL